MEPSRGSAEFGAVSPHPPGRGPASDELPGRSRGNHCRLCERSSTWLGREEICVEGEEEGRKEWRGGRQKNPQTMCFQSPAHTLLMPGVIWVHS